MIRRGHRTGEVPPEMLVYRVQGWPSCEAWRVARRDWLARHRPHTLDDLNALYASDVVLAPRPDPREVIHA